MEEPSKQELCQSLNTIDSSILFLLLIILSVLLSFWSVLIQRGQLCDTLRGDDEAAGNAPPVYPIKRAAAALVVGSLGFFLCLALDTLRKAEGGEDCTAKRSARTNLWASLFVLAAAILRLNDLDLVERSRQTALLETDTQPD